jgi:hypothetical protein
MGLLAGLLPGILLFFELVLFVAPERFDEVVDPAAQGAQEVGYAPGTQDEEHGKEEQDLEQPDAHR